MPEYKIKSIWNTSQQHYEVPFPLIKISKIKADNNKY